MFDGLEPGLVGEYETEVVLENSAQLLGCGSGSVFATPEMIRLMERAAVRAVDHLLPEGYRTVGISVDVRHLAATPLGLTVRQSCWKWTDASLLFVWKLLTRWRRLARAFTNARSSTSPDLRSVQKPRALVSDGSLLLFRSEAACHQVTFRRCRCVLVVQGERTEDG